MRDNFSPKIKRTLASRVAYRCSFAGCNRITVGPGTKDSAHVILVGEAAHIYSAAPNGPRNNPGLTPEQRSSVDNGIGMCNTHARLIDVDVMNYSPETLLKWKLDAENYVRGMLATLEQETLPAPLTLIMLNIEIVLQCKWVYVKEETWEFDVYNFIEGDVMDLREYINNYSRLPQSEKYIVVESQGDGRMVESISLCENKDGRYLLSCTLYAKSPRTNPHDVGGDMAMGDDGDLIWADGDMGMVYGIDCALQIIRANLSWEFGWWANPKLGSNFKEIYKKYRQSEDELNSMMKLELTRLITVPVPKGLFDDASTEAVPELNFINRINWVKVRQYDSSKPFLPIVVSLEWGNNENWEGELLIPFSLSEEDVN